MRPRASGMGPERPREPQGGRGERQSAAEGGEGAEHGHGRERDAQKREAKRVRRIAVGGVLRAGFWRLKRSYYPLQYLTPGTALL